MKVSKITVARLYNVGSYEHIRYEITVDVGEGDSAERALINLEKIMESLAPERSASVHTKSDLEREERNLSEIRSKIALSEDEFRRRYGFFEGSPAEYLVRCEKSHAENVAKRNRYEGRARFARRLLDDLGGTVKFTDAKLDWESDDDPSNL